MSSRTMAARRGGRLAAAVTAVAAAICVLGPPSLARAAATAPAQGIRPVACRPWTFNVHYGHNQEKCYTGVGAKVVDIPDVQLVTTGYNRGFFTYIQSGKAGRISFFPRETLKFPGARHIELVAIRII